MPSPPVDEDFALRRISGRFVDATVEKSFVASRVNKLLMNFRVMCLTGAVFMVFSVGGNFLRTGAWNTFGNLAVAMFLVAFLLLAAALASRGIGSKCGNCFAECGVLGAVIIAILVQFPLQPWYLAKLRGLTPVTPGHNILLALDVVITGAHLFLPLRWCALVLSEVVCLVAFLTLALAFGTPTARFEMTETLMFIFLLVCASLGKRSMQYEERKSFSRLIKETTLRVRAETEIDRRSLQQKNKISAVSENAFGTIGTTGDLSEEVASFLALAKQERWFLSGDVVDMENSEFVGKGGFGTVVTARLHGTPVAVKKPLVCLDELMRESACKLRVISNEIRLLRRLRHPNVVLFLGATVFQDQDRDSGRGWQLGIVLEYVEGEVLNQKLPHLHVCDILNVAVGLCMAIRYLHSRDPPVIHADLKPNNVMVVSQVPRAHAKIIDFGLACLLAKSRVSKGGAKHWQAPEQIGQPTLAVSKALDIFALGSILHYLEVGRPAMDLDALANDQLCSDANGRLPWRVGKRSIFSSAARDAAHECLCVQPQCRPQSLAVLQSLLEAVRNLGGPSSDSQPMRSEPACEFPSTQVNFEEASIQESRDGIHTGLSDGSCGIYPQSTAAWGCSL
eukprot:TRINITY_DN18689_c0_g1_i1.p1 TRINITY_DN18689_c0_g1~~TRINITY_DN18689_c0_g1_i1.p1  ORF type:complete len:621 (-),score=74.12 TRINITY_DN18689_c0_g1_i1:61-1923(-)